MHFTILCHTSQWLLWKFMIGILSILPNALIITLSLAFPPPHHPTNTSSGCHGWLGIRLYWTRVWPALPPACHTCPMFSVFISMFSVAFWLALWPVPLWSVLLLFYFLFPFESKKFLNGVGPWWSVRGSHVSSEGSTFPTCFRSLASLVLPRLPSPRKAGLFERVWGCLLVAICRDQKHRVGW